MASGYNDPEKLKAALELARSFKSSRAKEQQRGRKDARVPRGRVTTMGSLGEITPRTSSRSDGPPPISQRQYRDAGSFAPKANGSASSQSLLGGAAMAFLRRQDEREPENAPRMAPTIFPRLKTSADQAEALDSRPVASPTTTQAAAQPKPEPSEPAPRETPTIYPSQETTANIAAASVSQCALPPTTSGSAAQHKSRSVEPGQTDLSSKPLASENNTGNMAEGRNDHSEGSRPTRNAAVVHPEETIQDIGKLAAPSAGSFMEIFRAFAPPGVFPESPKKDKIVDLMDLGSPEKERPTLDSRPGTVPLSSTSSGTADDASPRNAHRSPRLPASPFGDTKPRDKPRLRPQAEEYIPASQHPLEALHQSEHLALAQTCTLCGWLYTTTEVHLANGCTTLGRTHGQFFTQSPPVAITQMGATQVRVPPGETAVFKHHNSWENGVKMTDSSSTAATKGRQIPVNSGADNANSSPSQARTNSSNEAKAVRVKKGLRDSTWA